MHQCCSLQVLYRTTSY